ncbi:RRP12-like protein isoform X2 [Tripterygium wilfordii]|uniref:RRP12-like protein isoform X2 n=1 Tax=Tripterygium wilfordii TaxID=458696 RepID=UPI0018F836F2|nr:RRP12-like protein isoform X2 [Tripterygium wilfordii]
MTMKPELHHQKLQSTREAEEEDILNDDGTDICEQLMVRYAASAAPQHRHLLATAAALRAMLDSETLSFTPNSYFLAAVNNLSDVESLDATAVSALLSFLGIVVPLMIPKEGIKAEKARDAVGVLVAVVEREGLGVASVKGVVKCLGALMVGFCDLEDWDSVELGFQTLLKFSIDKRPKVRKCAQDCLEKVFRSFSSSGAIQEASKLILSLFKSYMPLAVEISNIKVLNASRDEMLSRAEHLELLHTLNVVKLTVPYLSAKISCKVLSELHQIMNSEFSLVTRHVFNIIGVFYETSKVEGIIPKADKIIASLAAYVFLWEKNPADTVLAAATLLKSTLDQAHSAESTSWFKNIRLVWETITGLLTSEASTASWASGIMKELIDHHIDPKVFIPDENQSLEDVSQESEGAGIIQSICIILENTLSSCDGIPNEHILGVLSALFCKLGKLAVIFMKGIVIKLGDLMDIACGNTSKTAHLQSCIGSAVTALGPESMLNILPISLHADEVTYSNTWLIPILKDHIVGASLGYYMEHIVPLAKSFQQASRRAKKSVIGQDLQDHAHVLWGLLPAFCRYPVDTHQNFGLLAEVLVTFLRKRSFMHESVAVALQVLVNQNRSVLCSEADKPCTDEIKDSTLEVRIVPFYSKKTATRNIRALASSSTKLLQALINLFIKSRPEKQSYLKDAIGCLASITDSSTTKKILTLLLERFQFINSKGEFEKLGGENPEMIAKAQGDLKATQKHSQRCIIMNVASSLVEGANEDLIHLIYDFIVYTFQETETVGHCEAYHSLSRILEEHAWFCALRSTELIDLLLRLKPPVDVVSLRNRFACFQPLMFNLLKMSLEAEDTKAFCILNEIIITLKDSDDEGRKVAYDVLITICHTLKRSSNVTSNDPYQKLINMMMGYLSGSSPHITSGAVSALSVLVYQDADICLCVPDIVSSILSLLSSKAVEVIKAALGFVKVLVSCLQANDLQNILSDVLSGVLPWSSVSRHHFRSKVTVVIEILIRKCGFAAVEFVTPGKYKGFIKTVSQNRHGKSSSNEAGTTDADTVLEDSPSDRSKKRKHKELGAPHAEDVSINPRKRNKEKKYNPAFPNSREPHKFSGDGSNGRSKWANKANHRKSLDHESEDIGKKNKRDFYKSPSSGAKRRIGLRNMNKNGSAVHKPVSASRLYKKRRVGSE